MTLRNLAAILLFSCLLSAPATVWAACSDVLVFFQKGDTLDIINTDFFAIGVQIFIYRNDGAPGGSFDLPPFHLLGGNVRVTMRAKDLYDLSSLLSRSGLTFDNSYLQFSRYYGTGLFSLTITGTASVYQPQCLAP